MVKFGQNQLNDVLSAIIMFDYIISNLIYRLESGDVKIAHSKNKSITKKLSQLNSYLTFELSFFSLYNNFNLENRPLE